MHDPHDSQLLHALKDPLEEGSLLKKHSSNLSTEALQAQTVAARMPFEANYNEYPNSNQIFSVQKRSTSREITDRGTISKSQHPS
jgi:hypothetical protein